MLGLQERRKGKILPRIKSQRQSCPLPAIVSCRLLKERAADAMRRRRLSARQFSERLASTGSRGPRANDNLSAFVIAL